MKAKKITALFLSICLIVAMIATGVSASAAPFDVDTPVEYNTKEFTVKFNGEAVTFPDAQPFVDSNNRTLVPVRFVTEKMGAEVSWDQPTQTATIELNGITVKITIGKDTLTVTKNGSTSTVKMDTVAVNKESRTFVPVRFVAEALGAWVGYSDLFNTAQIYMDKLTPAEINRLHSHEDRSWSKFGWDPRISDEVFAMMNPQISHMSGQYGAENANEWILRIPAGYYRAGLTGKNPDPYVGRFTGKSFAYGKDANIECAKLAMDEVIAFMDRVNIDYKDRVHIEYKTDLSCVMWSRHLGDEGVIVRGVAHMTIPSTATQADIEWVEETFGLIGCVPGDDFVIDQEYAVYMLSGVAQVGPVFSFDI